MGLDCWEHASLFEIIRALQPGVSVQAEDRAPGDREVGVLKVSSVANGQFHPEESKAVVSQDIEKLRLSPKAGDVLISRANTHDLVGASCHVDRDYPQLFLPDKLWRVALRDSERDSSRWLAHVLRLPSVRRALLALATGTSGSMKNVSQTAFLRIRVPRPSRQEQDGIEDVLSLHDELAKELENLIQLKCRLKQGLMQQLLTGKRRFHQFVRNNQSYTTRFGQFPEDWPQVEIGQIARQVSERPDDLDTLTVLSCTKYRGLVDSLEYFGKKVFSEVTSEYKLVRRGQFAYATNHIEEGSIGLLLRRDSALVSPMYTVFETLGCAYAPFMYALFKTELYRHIFSANTNASVNRRGGLRWAQFAKIAVALPSLEEQKEIAKVFATCDREIELLECDLKLLNKQKSWLMTKLLTGEIRLQMRTMKSPSPVTLERNSV